MAVVVVRVLNRRFKAYGKFYRYYLLFVMIEKKNMTGIIEMNVLFIWGLTTGVLLFRYRR
jgi:hypothetical protein